MVIYLVVIVFKLWPIMIVDILIFMSLSETASPFTQVVDSHMAIKTGVFY